MDCAVSQDYSNISGDAQPVFTDTLSSFPWRRKWQPTLVLLPRKSHGRRSLVQATVHGVAKSTSRNRVPVNLSSISIFATVKSFCKLYNFALYIMGTIISTLSIS